MDDCIFCGIVAGTIPARIVREDARTIAFVDINPGSRGHCLVIPRRHAADLTDVPADDLAACAAAAQDLARRAFERLGAEGVNLVNSSRAAAWQTVFHFHLHVVPRYADDGLVLPWTPGAGGTDDLDEVAAALR